MPGGPPDVTTTETPFDALLSSARTDPEAAAGLALAYADMTEEARAKLLEVLIEDASSRAEVLTLMLGVEASPVLAERIADALRADLAGPASPSRDAGFAWGTHSRGGAALIRALHGGFVEGVSVRWEAREAEVTRLPLARAEDEAALRRKLGVPAEAAAVTLSHATDALAEGLWRLRQRRGSLPDELLPLVSMLP